MHQSAIKRNMLKIYWLTKVLCMLVILNNPLAIKRMHLLGNLKIQQPANKNSATI